jgi:hypothetical protein
MNLKDYACKLSELAPKVKLGLLEWDTSKMIRNLLNCEANQLERILCYIDMYGRIKCYEDNKTHTCVVTLQKETDKSRLAMLGEHF